MPKGMFTQGICLLLQRSIPIETIEASLDGYEIVKRVDASDVWEFGGPSLIVEFRPEVNGFISIDIVDRPWPDDMGDPKSNPSIFGAWSMGNFGPFTFPGGLQRASQQCWAWEPGQTIADNHKAFIRIRSSYVFGTDEDISIMPEDYDALPELEFVSRLAVKLLDLPGTLCYFNPNGEILRDKEAFQETLDFGASNEFPPIDAWSNIRLFQINEDWSLMDIVGNRQLDIGDSEVCFHAESYDYNELHNFLLNISLYLLNNGEVIKDGDTMDGPGEIRWQALVAEDSLCEPPRRVLRWLPMDGRSAPKEVLPSK